MAEMRKQAEWTDDQGVHRTGMTQAELAERVGWLSQSHIARIESGKYSTGLDHLQAIANAMGFRLAFVKRNK